MKIIEQADFDQAKHDPSELHSYDDKPGTGEFSDRGRADYKIRPNDPRFGDNPLADRRENLLADRLLDDVNESGIERLHQMLSHAEITDQQIRGGISLTQGGKMKIAARLGIGPEAVTMYLNSLVQQLRDQDAQSMDTLTEQYYEIINEKEPKKPNFLLKKAKKSKKEAGQSDRPFDLAEDRYSFEPDALGSITVRDAATGRSRFIQGAKASELLARLKLYDHDAVLAPLLEAVDDKPRDFWHEINANYGSYNFTWKLRDGRYGTATAEFHAAGNEPMLRLVDVRDGEMNEIEDYADMRAELLQQARDFIGKE